MRAISGSRVKMPNHEALRNRLATMTSGSSNGQPRSTIIETRVASRLKARRPAKPRLPLKVGRCVIGPSWSLFHPERTGMGFCLLEHELSENRIPLFGVMLWAGRIAHASRLEE